MKLIRLILICSTFSLIIIILLNNLYVYPNDHEKTLLNNLNQTSNTLKDKKDTDFFDKSLNSMLNEWSKIMSDIFHDFSTLIYINKYIKASDNLYEFSTNIGKDIWFILTKENRLIYVGVTLIFISFILYFINVSS